MVLLFFQITSDFDTISLFYKSILIRTFSLGFFVDLVEDVSIQCTYSQTSHKRPPKMSSLGGHLGKVVTYLYEMSDHKGSKF